MWMRPRAPRLARAREEEEDSDPPHPPLRPPVAPHLDPHPPGSSCLISLVHLRSLLDSPFCFPSCTHTHWSTFKQLVTGRVLWQQEVSLSPVFPCHCRHQHKMRCYFYFRNSPKMETQVVSPPSRWNMIPRRLIGELPNTHRCCFLRLRSCCF